MGWAYALAKAQGTSHVADATPCQDACFAYASAGDAAADKPAIFVGIVSDGAGSATYGGQGASLVCRKIGSHARSYLRYHRQLPDDDLIQSWLAEARDSISIAAERRASAERPIRPRDFAATLVALFIAGSDYLVAHIGDGSAVVKIDNRWQAISWPAGGMYASTTFFVTDQVPQLRITRGSGDISHAGVFSDGLERLLLDFKTHEPAARFFDAVAAPISALRASGRDAALSSSLAKLLNSEKINMRTDDDKSLILAARFAQ